MAEQLPMQPLHRTDDGVIRFRQNAIVRHLLDKGGLNMNDLAVCEFPQADREQFFQLMAMNYLTHHDSFSFWESRK